MHISTIAIGRMKQGPERELVTRYLDRAQASGRALGFSGFTVTELPESRAAAAAQRKVEEAKAINAALGEDAVVVALDERGRSLTSPGFAQRMVDWRDGGTKSIAFAIGGADGLDPDLVQRAGLTLSFSPLTWPHQLVRIMLAEQLYRATTILAGHPYHRGE